MSVAHSRAPAAVSSASSPANPVEAAEEASIAAVDCGLPESCEVAMPTALLNSYVVPACTAKSTASDACRALVVGVISSGLTVKPNWDA
jgi:hypothetical protein